MEALATHRVASMAALNAAKSVPARGGSKLATLLAPRAPGTLGFQGPSRDVKCFVKRDHKKYKHGTLRGTFRRPRDERGWRKRIPIQEPWSELVERPHKYGRDTRMGRKPIPIPDGVKFRYDSNRTLSFKGPFGALWLRIPTYLTLTYDSETKALRLSKNNATRLAHRMQGKIHKLIRNMIEGVHVGWRKSVQCVGIGYKLEVKPIEEGSKELGILMTIGLRRPLMKGIPKGLKVTAKERDTVIEIEGCDITKVTMYASRLRKIKKPDPYKGKGVRYLGEEVILKKRQGAGGGS